MDLVMGTKDYRLNVIWYMATKNERKKGIKWRESGRKER